MKSYWRCVLKVAEERGKTVRSAALGIFVSTNKLKKATSEENIGTGPEADKLRKLIHAYSGAITPAAKQFFQQQHPAYNTSEQVRNHKWDIADLGMSKLAWTELMILSRSDDMVVWLGSSFSESAWAVGGIAPHDERCTPTKTTEFFAACSHFVRACRWSITPIWPTPDKVVLMCSRNIGSENLLCTGRHRLVGLLQQDPPSRLHENIDWART